MIINPYFFPTTVANPSFVSVSAVSTTSTISVPAGVQNGDFLVAYVVNQRDTGISTPSGWTRLGSVFTWSTLNYATGLYYKIASSEPASYSFGSGLSEGFMAAYRNASAINANGSFEQRSGTSMTFTGITSASGSMLLSLIQDRDPSASFTQPSGMSLRLNSGGTYWRHGLADLLSASNSNRTWTVSSSSFDAVGILIAIK